MAEDLFKNYLRVTYPDMTPSDKEYLVGYMTWDIPLNKYEIIELINMMFRFQTRTGCSFKIEEYPDTIHVLTDPNKLCFKDVDHFFRRHSYLANKIWFNTLPNDKHILNIYEDCYNSRQIKEAPYLKYHCLEDIVKRPQSVSFILDS